MSLTSYNPTYRPFSYEWAMQYATDHENLHWHEGEADLSEDVKDWQKNLEPHEKNLIHQILRLFTQSDAQVGQNYIDFLLPTFKNNEVRCMLLSFAAREGIHQRAYALLNDTISLPESDYSAFLEYEEMEEKIEFMSANTVVREEGVALALAKAVFNEGVSLFGAFAMLLNFQRFKKMKGMCEIVRWSILDESQHVEGLSRLFRVYIDENPHIVNDTFKKHIYDMSRKVYELECRFIDLAFAMGDVKGLTAQEVKDYVAYLLDRRLIQIGLKANFNIEYNPLGWFDELMTGAVHENFFETRVTDYEAAGMSGSWDDCFVTTN